MSLEIAMKNGLINIWIEVEMKLLKSLLIAIGIVTLGFTIVIGEVLIFKVFGTVPFLLVMAIVLIVFYTILFYLTEKDN